AYLLVGLLLLCHNQNLQILSRDFLIESRLEGKCKSPQGENNSAAGYSSRSCEMKEFSHREYNFLSLGKIIVANEFIWRKSVLLRL
ncbi:MAG: hypothetical protein IJU76_03310, partial [Desulfovibrionaceae bacterium]|nr:hypothetical protein [Desulfovibrionaceae bacterium]